MVSSLKDRRVDFGLRPARLLNLCYELVPREQAADCRLMRIVEDSLFLDDPYFVTGGPSEALFDRAFSRSYFGPPGPR